MDMCFILKKDSDFWTSTLWVARLRLWILQLRDNIFFDSSKRNEFDDLIDPIFTDLESAYIMKLKISEIIEKHAIWFDEKSVYSIQNWHIIFSQNVDRELNDLFQNFILRLNKSIKDDLQKLMKFLWIDHGFFYQKDEKYEKWKIEFLQKNPKFDSFIEMLDGDRKWYYLLNTIRNWYEHDWFKLPDIEYDFKANNIVIPKEIMRIEILWENGWQFIEDVIIKWLSLHLQEGCFFVTVPEDQRDKSMPLKYNINWVDPAEVK